MSFRFKQKLKAQAVLDGDEQVPEQVPEQVSLMGFGVFVCWTYTPPPVVLWFVRASMSPGCTRACQPEHPQWIVESCRAVPIACFMWSITKWGSWMAPIEQRSCSQISLQLWCVCWLSTLCGWTFPPSAAVFSTSITSRVYFPLLWLPHRWKQVRSPWRFTWSWTVGCPTAQMYRGHKPWSGWRSWSYCHASDVAASFDIKLTPIFHSKEYKHKDTK